MAKQPKPGMPQSEKDKLGQALHEQTQRDLALENAARTVGDWRPDSELDEMSADQLRTEASIRGLELPKSASNDDAVRRLVNHRQAVERFIADRQAAAGQE